MYESFMLRSFRLIFRLFVSFSSYIFGIFSIFMFRSRKRALLRYEVFPSAFLTDGKFVATWRDTIANVTRISY